MPFHGTVNMRPSTGSLSPRCVMIDSDLIDGEMAPVSASASAPGSANSVFKPPAASIAARFS